MVWIVIFLLILLVVVLWLSCVVYRFAFHSPNLTPKDPYTVPPGKQYEKVADEMLRNIAALEELPYEQVTVRSYDGLWLSARFYRFFDRAPVMIQFHGYRGNAQREFANGYAIAQKNGFNALVVDQRGHGESEGHTITFGIKERYDCRSWAWYAYNRFGKETPILLSGVSMGAATVLMASDLKLPSTVKGILADCPYSSPGAIICAVCAKMRLPVWAAYPFAVLGALIYGRFCIWCSSPVKSVGKTKIPILLVHGEDDRLVPSSMSMQIYNVCRCKKRLLTVPDAGHGLSYLTDREKYSRALEQFLSECDLKQ